MSEMGLPLDRYNIIYRPSGSSTAYAVEDTSDKWLKFASDTKSECIVWVQTKMGWKVDGDEQTYGRQKSGEKI